jgi:ABC-type sulfate/molybdate transport systems ATPase subunit
MLILLDKPNVLILDEPDNDLDIDMLAVVENLLDSWPGTLLLITHDRHLMERVTDDQFAVVDGKIRHVPGGVDEYLRLLDARSSARATAKAARPKAATAPSQLSPESGDTPAEKPAKPALSSAEQHRLKKELASTERKLETACKKAETARAEMSDVDHSNYEALLDAQARIRDAEQQVSELEDVWMELSDRLHTDLT